MNNTMNNTLHDLDNTLHEMGWNDLIGNIRRATEASDEQKRTFAQKTIDGKIGLPRHERAYIDGTKDAARAYLAGEQLDYRGPADVVADMKQKTA